MGWAVEADNSSTSRRGRRVAGRGQAEQSCSCQVRAASACSQRAETAAQMQQLAAEDLPVISLVYPPLVTINRAGLVPGWEFTEGGVGGLVPSVDNKVAFLDGTP